jgi:hypothetical protein
MRAIHADRRTWLHDAQFCLAFVRSAARRYPRTKLPAVAANLEVALAFQGKAEIANALRACITTLSGGTVLEARVSSAAPEA